MNDHLEHHGIKGQKWGDRNGPPYPLAYDDHSSSEKKQNPKSTISYNDNTDDKQARKNRNMTIASLSLGVLTLNVPLAAISATDLIKNARANSLIKKYENERIDEITDKKTGFKKKSSEMSIEEDMKRVNPGFHNFNENTKNNCMLSSIAYDMRRRGYDVRANLSTDGYPVDYIKKAYKDAKIHLIGNTSTLNPRDPKTLYKKQDPYTIQRVVEDLKKQGDGARGNMCVIWRGVYGAHSVAYENVNGVTKIIDAQSNKIFGVEDFLKKTRCSVSIARTDNLEINVEEMRKACL